VIATREVVVAVVAQKTVNPPLTFGVREGQVVAMVA
jgi:hypothetical protein